MRGVANPHSCSQVTPVGGDWPYTRTFNAIAAAVKIEGTAIAISVKAFGQAWSEGAPVGGALTDKRIDEIARENGAGSQGPVGYSDQVFCSVKDIRATVRAALSSRPEPEGAKGASPDLREATETGDADC